MKNQRNFAKPAPKSEPLSRPAPTRHFMEFLSIRHIFIFFGIIELILVIFLLFQWNDIDRIIIQRHMAKKDWVGVKPMLERFYAKNATDWVTEYQMAMVYAYTGEPDKAFKCLDNLKDHFAHAQKDDKFLPEYYALLGKTYLAQGKIDEANSSTRQALAIDPQLPSANCVMGQIYMKRNDLVRAGNYMKYLAMDPGYKKELDEFNNQAQKMLEVPPAELNDVPEQVAVINAQGTVVKAVGNVEAAGTAIPQPPMAK